MTTLIFLVLFEIPSAGTLFLGVVIAILAALNAVQLYQRESKQRLREEVQYWKTSSETGKQTVDFAKAELDLVRQRCDRLEESTDALSKDNAVLRARTDLDALSKMLQAEGRRAQEMHEAILHGLENLAGAVAEMTRRDADREAQYRSLMMSQSELIRSLQSQVNLKEAMPVRRTA